ncbi:15840_t:CDS:1, partial [Dentiscutata heterogama]
IYKELVGSEPQANIFSSINSQIKSNSISQTDISNLIDINFQEESLFVTKKNKKKTKTIIREQPNINIVFETLDNSNYEKVTKIEPESDDDKETIIDYSAPDIESSNEEIFKNIKNLENFN